MNPQPAVLLPRRQALRSMIAGTSLFSGVLSRLLAEDDSGTTNLNTGTSGIAGSGAGLEENPLAPRAPLFSGRAKRVIFLFMNGGVSHVDSWDPKPRLFQQAGQSVSVDEWQGRKGDYKMFLTRPLWEFRRYGRSGIEVSDLFPRTAECVDDICVIRSMRSDHTNHYESTLGMHTGSFSFARPSLGSWVSYGLGSPNKNLPSFVVLSRQTPYAGNQIWASDFLPGAHQGTLVVPGVEPIANVNRRAATTALQELELRAMAGMNRRHLSTRAADPLLNARVRSFETAFGMQMEVPEVFDLSGESNATLDLYGVKRGSTDGFGWQCLMGRRLAEKGVRFIELIDGGAGAGNWDSHGNMEAHGPLAKNVDLPISGLLKDLKQRGMLDDTLVVWTTEFGRTPFKEAAGQPGREHHHWAFSSWMAGGGVRGGMVHGATDDCGIRVASDEVHVHDFHATILHLLGLDHEKLTWRHNGRDYRLTDVAGNVVRAVLA